MGCYDQLQRLEGDTGNQQNGSDLCQRQVCNSDGIRANDGGVVEELTELIIGRHSLLGQDAEEPEHDARHTLIEAQLWNIACRALNWERMLFSITVLAPGKTRRLPVARKAALG